jgi:hypothetical protein
MKDKTTWVAKGVIVAFKDVVDGEEIFQAGEELHSDERFDNIRYQIIDFTEVTKIMVTVEWVAKLAAWDKAAALSNPNMKTAIVAKDEAIQMLSSLYQAESSDSPWEIQIFSSMDEAQQWVL